MPSTLADGNQEMIENAREENSESSETNNEEKIVFRNRMEYLAILFALQSANSNLIVTVTKCARYNGISFLILYYCFHHLIIVPLQCQNLFLGFYSKFGYMKIWNIFPIGYGIGAGMMAFSLYTCINWSSLTGQLVLQFTLIPFMPDNYWTDCNYESKNLPPCYDSKSTKQNDFNCNKSYYPGIAQYYRVTNLWRPDETPDGIGPLNTKWIAASALVWIIVSILAIRDFKSFKGVFARLVYSTTIISFLMMSLRLLNGHDSDQEARYLTDLTGLYNYDVWVKALTHAILMSHICEGTLIQLGSYGPKNTMPDTDALLVGFVSSIFQYLAIFYIYSSYKWLADVYNMDMSCFFTPNGAILMALVPTQMSSLPKAKIWILGKFLISIIKGIMEMTIVFTSTVNSFSEAFPSAKVYRSYLVSVVTLGCFLMSLIFMTKVGEIFSNLSLDLVGSSAALLILAIMSSLILFSYSVSRLCDDIQFIHKFEPTLIMKAVFYLTPLFATYYAISHLATFLKFHSEIHTLYEKLEVLEPFLIVCCAVLITPLFIVALLMYGLHVRTHTVALLFRPTKYWGYPDDLVRELRSHFNPRRELKYMVKKPCAHICLLDDHRMQMEIQKRESIRSSLRKHGFKILDK